MIAFVDAITRETILKLTTRIADLEAAMEVHRAMLKETAHEKAVTEGKSFDPAAFDLHRTEALQLQREKMALGTEPAEPLPGTPVVLDLPEVSQE